MVGILSSDPLGLKPDRPKKPKKTDQELAIEKRQREALDKEIGKEESRFKLLSRGKLGRSSLLSGVPKTTTEGVAGRGRGGRGRGSLLPGLPGSPSPRSTPGGPRNIRR